MKRMAITLEQIADRENLLLAVAKAARGKHSRPEVAAWLARLEPNIAALAATILNQTAPLGQTRQFIIHDPKRRTITAACFADRVLHHAILNIAEQRFERALVPTSFACRPGLGVHAAVARVRDNLQRFGWWAQVDIAGYFNSIDHGVLKALLARRFKGRGFLDLLNRIIDASPNRRCDRHGRPHGLPIGALTSQHFANAYLDGADRWLLANPDVRAHVRYMDDIVWWCNERHQAREILRGLRRFLADPLRLELKSNVRIGPSRRGIAFCGFRVKPGVVLPSSRKMTRYRQGRKQIEQALHGGAVNELEAQRAGDVLNATLSHTESLRFRQRLNRAMTHHFRGYNPES